MWCLVFMAFSIGICLGLNLLNPHRDWAIGSKDKNRWIEGLHKQYWTKEIISAFWLHLKKQYLWVLIHFASSPPIYGLQCLFLLMLFMLSLFSLKEIWLVLKNHCNSVIPWDKSFKFPFIKCFFCFCSY